MNIIRLLSIVAIMSITTEAQSQNVTPIRKADLKLESDRMTPEVLWAMGRIGSTAISPKGDYIAYTVSYYSVELNRSQTVIYVMKADGSDQRLLTQGGKSEVEPAFIHGGERIAFMTGGALWSMNLEGGDRKQLTREGDEIDGFLFSPDEKHVILIREIPSTTSIQAKEADLPMATGMVIDDLNYKHWDHYVTDIPHPFLASYNGDKVSEELKDLLDGEPYECPVLPFGGTEELAWSPDSKFIAYESRKKTGVDYVISTDTDIFLYNVETGETTNLCKPVDYVAPKSDPTLSLEKQAVNQSTADINVGYDTDPQFSPDGTMLAWKSMKRDGYESDRNRLCVLSLASGEKRYVTEQFDEGVEEFVWGSDNASLYFVSVQRGRILPFATNLNGEVKPLLTGDYDYGDISLMPKGDQLLVKRHSISAPEDQN